MTQKLQEMLGIVSCIDPDHYGLGTLTGDAIDLSKFHKVLFVCTAGSLESSCTVDYKVTGCSTSGGLYADITGKAITQLTAAGSDSDKQVIIEVDAIEAKAAGYNYLKDSLIIAGGSADAASIALAGPARYGPASDNDLASVDELVGGTVA